MKKSIFASMGMLAISAITVISCSKDEEFDDQYNLSVEFRTPKTRSSSNGVETESSGNGYQKVPTYENECMLWSILSIAVNKGATLTFADFNGSTTYKKIGNHYSASTAYRDVKALAIGQQWYEEDENGNTVTKTYQGGAMPPSIAANISKSAGIMEGVTVNFETYDQLYNFITNPSWANKHPAGTYIISNNKERHASVCNGVTDKGNIKLQENYDSSTPQSTRYSNKRNGNDGFVLIY